MKLVAVVWLVPVALLMASMSEAALLDETIYSSIRSSTTRDLIQTAGIQDILNGTGNYTFFLPVNVAHDLELHNMTLSQIKQDPKALRTYLLSTLVNGSFHNSDVHNEQELTTYNGGMVRFNNYLSTRLFNGIQGLGDFQVSNGIVRVVRHGLPVTRGNIMQQLDAHPDLSIMANLTRLAGLESFFQDQNPVTLFAPTDTAFQQLGAKMDNLTSDTQILATILKYHTTKGSFFTGGLHSRAHGYLPTFHEGLLNYYNHGGHMMIHGERIVSSGGINGFPATNGVVHKLNGVLIPQSLVDQV